MNVSSMRRPSSERFLKVLLLIVGTLGVSLLLVTINVIPGKAQTLIFNEITFWDPSLKDEDNESGFGWIELKNTGSLPASTKDLELIVNDSLKWELPEYNVPPEGFMLIWLSGKDRREGVNLHTNFNVENVPNNSFKLVNRSLLKTVDSIKIHTKMDWYESYNKIDDAWFLITTRTPLEENQEFGYWKRISYTAPFKPRDSAPTASLYYNDKFWILGGWTGDSFNPSKEIWVSDDLLNWELVTSESPFKGDAFFIVFNNKMWAFDGNAYTSTDGLTWDIVATDLPFSVANRVALFKDKLWVVHQKSIYTSEDGISWSAVTDEAPWESRELPGWLSFKGKLWFFGGAPYHQSQNPAYTDVWSSEDGVEWKLETDSPGWPGKAWFGSAVFDNKMWIYSGWDYYLQDDTNDVWYSEDGITWNELKSVTIWAPRHAPYTWVARGALWISSGFYTMHFGLLNDVWKLEPLSDYASTSYYLKSSGQVDQLTDWGHKKDGSGFPPVGFNYDNQKFVITNNDFVSLENDWEIGGTGSSLAIGNGTDVTTFTIEEDVALLASLTLESFATLILKSKQSPNVEYAAPRSKAIVDVRNNHRLQADELANLVLKNGSTSLSGNLKIRESLEVIDGSLSEAVDYDPTARLLYTSTSSNVLMEPELYSINRPSSVTVNCDCEVIIKEPLKFDSLYLLKNAKLKIAKNLDIEHITQSSKSNYIITVDSATVSLPVIDSTVFFPIGTEYAYRPLKISKTDALRFSASVSANNLLRPEDVSWFTQPLGSDDAYEATVTWNPYQYNAFCANRRIVTLSASSGWEEPDSLLFSEQVLDQTNYEITQRSLKGKSIMKMAYLEGACEEVANVVFPNPSQGTIYLIPPSSKLNGLELLDINGRFLNSFVVNNVYPGEVITLHLNVSRGVYLLKIFSEEKIDFVRVVIGD